MTEPDMNSAGATHGADRPTSDQAGASIAESNPPGPFSLSRSPDFRRFALAILVLLLCFSRPLYDLIRFALHSDLYSHIVLVPVISLYLGWVKRRSLPPPSAPNRGIALVLLAAGTLALTGYGAAVVAGTELAREDALALTTFSFVFFFAGTCSLFLGRQTLAAIAFPLGFLVFMAPLPAFFERGIETLLQYGSAGMALTLFKLSGTPVFYQDLVFKLQTISLEVAPQCSGIHSSVALFITSLLAGYLFLHTTWKRIVLALLIIPLAVLRNGVRIFTIGELCVHLGPDMINSYIHRHGGPVFFALSLIPLFLVLGWLIRSDRANLKTPAKPLVT